MSRKTELFSLKEKEDYSKSGETKLEEEKSKKKNWEKSSDVPIFR